MRHANYQYGKGRATKDGRVRAAILPELKAEAMEIASNNALVRTMGRFTEFAYSFYIEKYHEAGGHLDSHGHPLAPTEARAFKRKAS
jgi:hypothetical protein